MAAYLGTWHLIPELSHYDLGGPPDRGTYRIEDRNGVLHFTLGFAREIPLTLELLEALEHSFV